MIMPIGNDQQIKDMADGAAMKVGGVAENIFDNVSEFVLDGIDDLKDKLQLLPRALKMYKSEDLYACLFPHHGVPFTVRQLNKSNELEAITDVNLLDIEPDENDFESQNMQLSNWGFPPKLNYFQIKDIEKRVRPQIDTRTLSTIIIETAKNMFPNKEKPHEIV